MSSVRHVREVQTLYRQILRLHRRLPTHFRAIGDQYTKDEFHRHKKAGAAEVQTFMREWKVYLFHILVTFTLDFRVTGSEQWTTLPSTSTAILQNYAKMLQEQLAKDEAAPVGESLPPEKIENFTDEQLGQLFELQQETTKPISEELQDLIEDDKKR
uniref:Succinate dehydrogenase assembly factor 3 n=1 Tax=Branchiostoma floridae TaxID=7739 RepID=C3YA28_BRAFL|eukprot:XP_002606927.1 hypothetical protein BRAFLDRAFT_126373 [Branchiostoma floridae]